MSLDKAMKNLKFDKRLTEWSINNGQLSKEDHKKYLEQLPDLANNVDLIKMGDEEPTGDTH